MTNPYEQDEDEWVETDYNPKNMMPIEKKNDPAEVIEINARMYEVSEFYLDKIIVNLRGDSRLQLTSQDKELLDDAITIGDSKKPHVKESTMRLASLIICDVIEKIDTFGDGPDKKSILVFLPGLHEIFEFIDFLNEWYDQTWIRNTLEIIPLHSSLCE
jgi:HrpA-like RNA helicase